jgi:hypothetical protein
MIAQSMAREYGPLGIHVAHVVIDGGIGGDRLLSRMPSLAAERGEDGLLGIDAIADTYWNIHKQQRSAWTQEVDLRPFKEGLLTGGRALLKISAHVAITALRASQNFGEAPVCVASCVALFSVYKRGGFYDPQSESGLARHGP